MNKFGNMVRLSEVPKLDLFIKSLMYLSPTIWQLLAVNSLNYKNGKVLIKSRGKRGKNHTRKLTPSNQTAHLIQSKYTVWITTHSKKSLPPDV